MPSVQVTSIGVGLGAERSLQYMFNLTKVDGSAEVTAATKTADFAHNISSAPLEVGGTYSLKTTAVAADQNGAAGSYSQQSMVTVTATPDLAMQINAATEYGDTLTTKSDAKTGAAGISIDKKAVVTLTGNTVSSMPACSMQKTIVYQWSVVEDSSNNDIDPGGAILTNQKLIIASSTLDSGKTYTATLVAKWQGETAHYKAISASISVNTQPIDVTIDVGSAVMVGAGQPLALNAVVFDRDEGAFTLGYQWSISPNAADSSKIAGLTTAKLALQAGALSAGTSYKVTITVAKPNTPTVQSTTTVTVKSGTIPIVRISRKNAAKPFEHLAMLKLEGCAKASATDACDIGTGFAYKWDVKCVVSGVEYDVCNPFLDLEASAVPGSGTSTTTRDLALSPEALNGNGKIYKFYLNATKQLTGESAIAAITVTTNYPPACSSSGTCVAITPAQGETLATSFTFKAPTFDTNTKSGWNDVDGPDASMLYQFGYYNDDSEAPVMFDTSSSPGVNTLTTTSLPVGKVKPVVFVRDIANGKSHMAIGAAVTVCVGACGSTPPLGSTVTGQMSTKLDAQIASLSGAANRNKLAAMLQSVATTINQDTAPAAFSAAEKMRTKMASQLKAAVSADSPGNSSTLDVHTAAAALESIAAQPTQLTDNTQSVLVSVVDAILDGPTAKTDGVSNTTAASLLSGVGGVAAARAPAIAEAAEAAEAAAIAAVAAAAAAAAAASQGSSSANATNSSRRALASSRRSLVGEKMMVQMRSIALAAARQMQTESPPLVVSGSGITTTIYKEHKSALGSNHFGTSGTVFKMPSDIAPWTATQDEVVVETTDLPYAPSAKKIYSNVVSLSVSLTDGTALSPETLTNALEITFTLSKATPSPVCMYWDGSSGEWHPIPGAIQTDYHSAGATVTCKVNRVGSFAIGASCFSASTCSAHGSCKSDGSCECSLGWTGESCKTRYCDRSLFKCQNKGRCVCTAPPYDCMKECKKASSQEACSKKCPACPVDYSVEMCPLALENDEPAYQQTRCDCPCGYKGVLCEVEVTDPAKTLKCNEDDFKKREEQEAKCFKAASPMRAPVQWMLLISVVLPATLLVIAEW